MFAEGIEAVLVTFTIIGRDFEHFHKLSLSPDPSNVKQQVDRITHSRSSNVVHGDCIQVLSQVSSESVDFVLTDPPYIAKYVSRDGQKITNDDRADWLQPAFKEIFRVLKKDAFCVSFYGWHQVDKFMQAWRIAGFRPVGHLVFQKSYSSKEVFLSYRHEMAYLLAKGNPRLPERPIADVLQWKYSGNKFHPTQKPVSNLMSLIRAFSKPGSLILDPFCGSGSTLVAAAILGRRFMGIELSNDYCETARRRTERVRPPYLFTLHIYRLSVPKRTLARTQP